MKHFFTVLILLCSTSVVKAYDDYRTSYDFEVGGIYYNILSKENKTVAVTYHHETFERDGMIVMEKFYPYEQSRIVIPKDVTYNDVTYSVTSIGNYTFRYCTDLSSITIPNSVTSIGDYAFYDCHCLKEVINFSNLTISKGSSSNGDVVCYATKVINAPNGFIDGDFIWYENEDGMTLAGYLGNATELAMPTDYNGNSVTSIGDDAFSGCSGLTNITIPNSITSIGSSAFYDCTGLKTVINFSNLTFSKGSSNNGYVAYYADKVYNAPNGSIEGDFIFGKLNDVNTLVGYLGNATEITLPDNYNGENYTIGNRAFSYCDGLKSITIPNSVISIGEYAFYDCDGLIIITIPNSVTSIGEYAFMGCDWLISITISSSVTSIGDGTFSSCSRLTSITIPNSVTSIGNSAFRGCTGLTSITIPNSVTSIGDDAFYGCSGLTSITIPNSVTSIGNYAFSGCSGLTSITIPNSVTSIGNYAFSGCSGLKTVINFSNLTFSKGSSNNGYVAYYADKVYNAPNGSFEGDFIFGKPNDVNTLVGYLGNATELTLPAGYNGENYAIGAAAFQNYTGLAAELIIHNNITGIGASAFKGCNNIEKLYIGSSVESIGDKAFAGCEKITEIKVALEKPIKGSDDIFANAVYDNATLYIPNGTKSLYEKREPWNIFFDIVEMDFTGIDDMEAEGERVQTIYDLQGRKVEVPSEGLYIINGKKVMIK